MPISRRFYWRWQLGRDERAEAPQMKDKAASPPEFFNGIPAA
jgi:hypothetical protein